MSTYYVVPGRRGRLNTAYSQPRGPLVNPYRAQGAPKGNLGNLGDRYVDAVQSAWNASHWTYGRPVTSVNAAITAAHWAYGEAAKEAEDSESDVNWFNDLARKTPYTYAAANLSANTILRTVVNETRSKAPLISRKVGAILTQSSQAVPAAKKAGTAPPKKKKRSGGSTTVSLPAAEEPRESFTAKLPTWWPWATAAAAIAAAWLLIPSRKSVVVVQKAAP